MKDSSGRLRLALTSAAINGAVNGSAPNPVTNADFTRALAAALRRPAIFPVPPLALKLMFGEMSEMLLGSQRVAPKAAEASGYQFQFPHVGAALADVVK